MTGARAIAPYGVLVNSCDAYADCWPAFFALLARFWPLPVPPTYLNTETRDFTFPGLPIQCSRIQPDGRPRLPWGECLLRCLDAFPHEIVLYLQDDYFLKGRVDTSMLDRLISLMQAEDIAYIGLERGLTASPGPTSPYPMLSYVAPKAEYRISTQAGLWRVDALRSYLRPHETVWEFEWYGTRRAWRRQDTFLYVDESYRLAHGQGVVPYDPTGIVQGRWVQEVVEELFAHHGIRVDFSARGFHDPRSIPDRPPRITRALRRARSLI